jgi:predicted MFS family arabinose efflux permease
MTAKPTITNSFTSYQKIVIALLAVIQFTVVLDFMVMAPLGDILMKSMHLNAAQFASAVSAYAFSAGIAGILAAGFADKYDRKKLLVLFYVGFSAGTALCATAKTFPLLIAGRIVTGLFSGVLGAAAMAIVADLFSFDQRGRVMGFTQMSFAVSQVAGIPIGLYLANQFNWHAPFAMIVAFSIMTMCFTAYFLKPVTRHLVQKQRQNPLAHLQKTFSNKVYWLPFIATALLSIGGFMLMPFSTPFMVNNVDVSQKELPLIYVVMGICSMIALPMIGKLSDQFGKFATFIAGTGLAMIMVVIYTNLTPVPIWKVIVISALMFAGVMSRMIPSTALMTAIPKKEDRGAFMSINSSLQQIAGGVAAVIAGWVIFQKQDGKLLHFNILGYICIGIMVVCAFCVYYINKRVLRRIHYQGKERVELVA